MNDDELTALLDRAIGPGPTGPDLDVVLRQGSRAARRRRAGLAAALAAAVVIAGAGAVAAAGTGDSTGTSPVVQPTPTEPAPPMATDTVSLDDLLDSGALAELREGGLLRLKPGVEVVRWVDNPLDWTAPNHSMGLVLRHGDEETWHLLDYYDLGSGWTGANSSSSDPHEEAGTFDAWLAQQVALAPDLEDLADQPSSHAPEKQLVELQADGTLDLAPGVEVLQRIENPVGQVPPNRSVAVAFTYEGRERWAVLEVLVSDDGQITGASAVDAFANEAKQDTLAEYAAANPDKIHHP